MNPKQQYMKRAFGRIDAIMARAASQDRQTTRLIAAQNTRR